MNELVYLKKDDAFTDSMVIAEATNNQHKSVVAIIRKYHKDLEDYGSLEFSDLKSLNSKRGRPTRIYQLSEEQAMLLITYLDNNEIVREFKKKLVHQFTAMRKLLAERHTATWLETRQQGKLTRKAETDIIKQLVEYAKKQGSSHADMLYVTYTKLANKIIGVKHREDATTMQLNNLSLAEHIIKNVIDTGIHTGMNYKDIYKESKKRLELFSDVAMLEVSA